MCEAVGRSVDTFRWCFCFRIVDWQLTINDRGCNQCRLIELFSFITDADAPAFLAVGDWSTAVNADAADQELCGWSTVDNRQSGSFHCCFDLLVDRSVFSVLLLLFRCCNQRLLTKFLSSSADGADGADDPAVATDQSTAVVTCAADHELWRKFINHRIEQLSLSMLLISSLLSVPAMRKE